MSGFNMAAAGLYGLYPNLYNNQIALNDLTGLDVYPPAMMGMDPMLSMNASIFGAYPGGMGGMMPFMPTFSGGGYNYEDYYKNYQKYQDFMIDNQVNYQQKMRNANLRLNAPEEGIAKQAGLLHEKIMQNEQEQIIQAYKDFKDSVRNLYGANANEKDVANRASSLYKQCTGVSIHEDIRKYGRDSFTQGFLQTLTFGFADGKTAEENISELTGQPVGRAENAKKFAGNIVGGAVIGGGALASASLIWKGIKTGAKSKTFWGILAGAAVGTMAALGLTKNLPKI